MAARLPAAMISANIRVIAAAEGGRSRFICAGAARLTAACV
jgi:hypothetical protein